MVIYSEGFSAYLCCVLDPPSWVRGTTIGKVLDALSSRYLIWFLQGIALGPLFSLYGQCLEAGPGDRAVTHTEL